MCDKVFMANCPLKRKDKTLRNESKGMYQR